MNENDIKTIMEQVKYPGFNRDIVSFGMVRSITLEKDMARITLKFANEKDEVRQQIMVAVREALQAAGIQRTEIEIEEAPAQPSGFSGESEALPSVKHTLAVASGKGGVGKSTVAANLAAALSSLGHRVGILDLDVYGPSLPVTMGIHETPRVENGNRLVPLKKHGMELMSLGFMLTDASPVIWRGAMVAKMVQQFLRDVAWSELDYMILDLPPGTGDVQLTLVQRLALTGAIIVTTPQDLALKDVQRGAEMFGKVNTPVLGIVENMSYHVCEDCGHVSQIFSSGGGEKESQRLGVPLLGKLPLNETIMKSAEAGEPIVLGKPDNEASQVFLEIGRKLVDLVTT